MVLKKILQYIPSASHCAKKLGELRMHYGFNQVTVDFVRELSKSLPEDEHVVEVIWDEVKCRK